jgi:predicted esterase
MPTRLHDLQRQLFELYRQERYGEALELVTASLGKSSDGTSRMAFWSACLQCKLERPEHALATLIHHFELGEWFNPDRLARDEDLAPLRDNPEFERLIEACQERRQTEQADLQPLLLMEAAATVEEWTPLVLALHMMGADAVESRSHWLPVTKIGAALAAPRGTELLGPGEFGWGEGAEAVLRRQLVTVAERQPFDPDRLVLGGASQGARLAVLLALRGALSARGFIAVVGAPPPEKLEPHLDTARKAGVRGFFITGERDPARAGVEAAYRLLASAGLEVRLEVVPGLGHEYPVDMAPLLENAMRFVLA